ncbi:butyrophilin subfamily 2 member A2 [Antennarius striatus]|uniref:butyrophilin subfamily 2 member A2 n=1 Tax=Antennarius striatus TaxID=241820 RepID=UPI0035AFD525
MAFTWILLISTAICHIVGNSAFEIVECKTGSVGEYGQKSLLECVVKPSQVGAAPQIRMVAWKKDGFEEALLVFHKGKIINQLEGYSFADPSWNDKNMNVSLLISDTTLQHQGSYTCEVATVSGPSEPGSSSLSVTAKYSKPTIISLPETTNQNTDGTLVCKSEGGYPKGQLRWFDERDTRIKNDEIEVMKTESGLFQLSSKLTLKQGSVSSKYTCAVFNASEGKQDEVQFNVPEASNGVLGGHAEGQGAGESLNPISKVVAPLVVIGSLIVGLLLVLVYYRRRSQRRHLRVHTCEMADEEIDCRCDDGVAKCVQEAEQIP